MPNNNDSNWGKFAVLGLQMGVGAGLGAAVGIWIDHRYGSGPWGVLIGTCLGFASGMYLLIKEAMRANKN